MADRVYSTGKMVKGAKETDKKTIVLGTEAGMVYRLKKENPEKDFFPARDTAYCFNMKKIDLNGVLRALENRVHRIEVPPDIQQRALGAIEQMIQIKGVKK